MTEPDPRTDSDDLDDAAGEAVPTQAPAEGDDSVPGKLPGSPQG